MVENTQNSQTLGTKQEKYMGDTILQTQVMDEKFSHVSSTWTAQCKKFDDVIEQCKKDSERMEDIRSPLSNWKPIIEDGTFKLEYADGRKFTFTDHSMTNLCYHAGVSSTMPCELRRSKLHATKVDKDGEKVVVYKRDSRDAETLKTIFQNSLFADDRTDQKKVRLFRTWNGSNPSIRAVLSSKYAIIPNLFVLETLKSIIKDGLVSHYRSSPDYLKGNILIPDSIRKETDSDFGGMVHFGNDEIGQNRLSTQPAVFRAICMNGTIWNEEAGFSINKKHLGKIDLNELRTMIYNNVQKQIPLLTNGIDQLLATRSLKIINTSMVNIFAQLAQEYPLNRKHLTEIATQFTVEKEILSNDVFSCYGLINSITRAGQKFDDDTWEDFDRMGGDLIMCQDQWNKFLGRANTIDNKVIEKIFGTAA